MESKRSVLPHWDGEVYTRYAAPFYDFVTGVTGWRRHLASYGLEGLAPCRLLDVGCGTAMTIARAARLGFFAVGVDPSAGMLACGARRLGHGQATLVRAGAKRLPFAERAFDAVIATGALVHVPDIACAAKEILRVCAPGGRIRIIDHARPTERSALTPIAALFSQGSGDILHDYPSLFSEGTKLESHLTLGRGGYLQRYDFIRD